MTAWISLTPAQAAKALGDLGPVETLGRNRLRVPIAAARIREGIQRATGPLRCDHLVQIATVDAGTAFELTYSLTGPHRTVVSLRIALPRDRPSVPSVHDLLPPAAIYERQIHDLFGIAFEGHPNLRRLILNEDWPEGEYPLRKDWTMDPAKAYGGVPPEVE